MTIIKQDPLSQNPFAFSHVKRGVLAGLREDCSHVTVDDAKKRAVKACASYDEFKAIVATSGLVPVRVCDFTRPPKDGVSMNYVYNKMK